MLSAGAVQCVVFASSDVVVLSSDLRERCVHSPGWKRLGPCADSVKARRTSLSLQSGCFYTFPSLCLDCRDCRLQRPQHCDAGVECLPYCCDFIHSSTQPCSLWSDQLPLSFLSTWRTLHPCRGALFLSNYCAHYSWFIWFRTGSQFSNLMQMTVNNLKCNRLTKRQTANPFIWY